LRLFPTVFAGRRLRGFGWLPGTEDLEKRLRSDRLDDVKVEAGLCGLDPVGLLSVAGQSNELDADQTGQRAEAARGLIAFDSGKSDVEQDHVRLKLRRCDDRGLTVREARELCRDRKGRRDF